MEHPSPVPAASSEEYVSSKERFALGIDVSRIRLDLALLGPQQRLLTRQAPNDPVGFAQIVKWLMGLGIEARQVRLEATAGYEAAAARYLFSAGCRVSVVNPRQTSAYAGVQLRRSKTDRADAALIARYCNREQPVAWHPPAPQREGLRELTRGLEALRAQRARLRQQLDGVTNEHVRTAFEAAEAALTEQIKGLEARVEELMCEDDRLRQDRDLLETIPGVGRQTATAILAEIGEIQRFRSAREAAAYAGLVPAQTESGATVRRPSRMSKVGNGRLRHALYMPAISALRFNGVVRAFGERLLGRGKARKAVVGAAMRKLLHLCYGVLKSGRPFDPTLHFAC